MPNGATDDVGHGREPGGEEVTGDVGMTSEPYVITHGDLAAAVAGRSGELARAAASARGT